MRRLSRVLVVLEHATPGYFNAFWYQLATWLWRLRADFYDGHCGLCHRQQRCWTHYPAVLRGHS